jgi:molecular chaperone GrpE
MSEEKQVNPEQVENLEESTTQPAEGGASVEDEVQSLKSQLEAAEARADEYKDSWARSQAEFQNYKKRVERDNEMMYAGMKGDIIKKVLPVLDDLERAMLNRPVEDAWASGIDLIVRKLQSILEVEGVIRIEAAGTTFDPNFHEAISHEAADGFESGQVIEVVQNGYRLGDRVIRPAMVRVAQ